MKHLVFTLLAALVFSGAASAQVRPRTAEQDLFALGRIHLSTGAIHTVKPLEADIPNGRLTVVTGVSGSGKTTLILESLIPGLEASIEGRKLPEHVRSVTAEGIRRVKLIDAAPIGVNVRSTVATYADVHDELRKLFARTPDAKRLGYKAGDFSYNTGRLRCPVCDGTGSISLDVQFLPDVDIPCPECRGSRYGKDAGRVRLKTRSGAAFTLPELMDMDIHMALDACTDWKVVHQRLQVLEELGLSQRVPPEAPELLEAYGRALLEKNQVMNLTAITQPDQVARLHMLDCAALLNYVHLEGKTLLDVGTGAGFPGLPLKILCPTLEVTLLDSLGKRVRWLREVSEQLGLSGVTAIHARSEEQALVKGFRDSFDFVTARAVADLRLLAELCLPFVKVGGVFLAMKSVDCGPEVEGAAHAIKLLGGRVRDQADYQIPGTEITHRVVAIEKVAPTLKGYPRRWAKIQKEPL